MLDGDKTKKTRCRAQEHLQRVFLKRVFLFVFTFRHLPSRSLGNAVRNLRVVDLSGESLRTDTDGKDGDVAVRVAAALPANQGTFGESAAGSVADAAQRGEN